MRHRVPRRLAIAACAALATVVGTLTVASNEGSAHSLADKPADAHPASAPGPRPCASRAPVVLRDAGAAGRAARTVLSGPVELNRRAAPAAPITSGSQVRLCPPLVTPAQDATGTRVLRVHARARAGGLAPIQATVHDTRGPPARRVQLEGHRFGSGLTRTGDA